MPRPGRNNKRENEIRRIKTVQAREDKVVLGYFKRRHPKIYEEAKKYAKELATANPGKMDLTKTPEYYTFLKGPNMELKIQLMDEGEAQQEHPDQGDVELKIQLMDEGEAQQEHPDQGDATAEAPQELQGEAQPAIKDLELPPAEGAVALPLNDEDFNAVMNDLSQDPTIQDFFNNFDFELDNCPLW